MARARFVVVAIPSPGERVRLSPSEAAHARARRLRVGEVIVLLDGSGALGEAEVTSLGRVPEAIVTSRTEAPPDERPLWLGVAAVRGERLAWIAEKASELAVSALVLVRSERTQGERASKAALERVERLVREAAKQSGASRWPSCRGPISLDEALADGGAAASARLFVDFSGDPFPARIDAMSCALLVGPEGGWTTAERKSAVTAGWTPVSLPAATLRTETAAVASVVLARAALARLRGTETFSGS